MTNLLRSELRKIFTTRLWWGLLIGVILASVALSVLSAALSGQSIRGAQAGPGLDDPAMVRSIYTAGAGISYLFVLAFGIIAMSGEYRQQTMTATVLTSPRRIRVVVAKVMAVLLVALGYGVIMALAGVASAVPVILLRHGTLFLTSDGVPQALGLVVVAIALWGVIGLGVGTLIRNQVVALLVAVGIAWIVEPIAAALLNAGGIGAVAQYLPSQATTAVVSPSTSGNGVDLTLLPWWAGALVLVGYALVSGGLGAMITLRRDLT